MFYLLSHSELAERHSKIKLNKLHKRAVYIFVCDSKIGLKYPHSVRMLVYKYPEYLVYRMTAHKLYNLKSFITKCIQIV